MALLRTKLFAGALFSGLLYGQTQEVPAVVPQPLANGIIRERVVQYESRNLEAYTYQQLSQESGSRLYAIDNTRQAYANSLNRLRSEQFAYCDATESAVSVVVEPNAIQLVSTHYQLNQSQHSFVETQQIIEQQSCVIEAQSASSLHQVSVAEAFISFADIEATASSESKLLQMSVAKVDVSASDDDEMMMVLLLLNDMDT